MLRQLRPKNAHGTPIKVFKSKRHLIQNAAAARTIYKHGFHSTGSSFKLKPCLSLRKKYTTSKVCQRASVLRVCNSFRKKHSTSKAPIRAHVGSLVNSRKNSNHFALSKMDPVYYEQKPLCERYSYFKRFPVNPRVSQRSIRDLMKKKTKKIKPSIDNIEFLFGSNERPLKRYYPVQVASYLRKIRKKKQTKDNDKFPPENLQFSNISSKIREFFLQYIDPPDLKTEKSGGILEKVSTMIEDCTSQIKEFFGYEKAKVVRESENQMPTSDMKSETQNSKIDKSIKPTTVCFPKKKISDGKEYSTYWSKYRLDTENDVEKKMKDQMWEEKKDQALIIGKNRSRNYNRRRSNLVFRRNEPEMEIEKLIKQKEMSLKKAAVPSIPEINYSTKSLINKHVDRMETLGNFDTIYKRAEMSIKKLKKETPKKVRREEVYQPLGRYSLKFSLADEEFNDRVNRRIKANHRYVRKNEDFRNWK